VHPSGETRGIPATWVRFAKWPSRTFDSRNEHERNRRLHPRTKAVRTTLVAAHAGARVATTYSRCQTALEAFRPRDAQHTLYRTQSLSIIYAYRSQ
jgi:hypothetical protein